MSSNSQISQKGNENLINKFPGMFSQPPGSVTQSANFNIKYFEAKDEPSNPSAF